MASLFRAGVDIFLTEIRSRFVSLFSFFLPPLSFLSFFSFPPFFFFRPLGLNRGRFIDLSIGRFRSRSSIGSTRGAQDQTTRAQFRAQIYRGLLMYTVRRYEASNSNATRLRRTLVVDSRRMQQGTSKLRTLSMIMTTIREIRNV